MFTHVRTQSVNGLSITQSVSADGEISRDINLTASQVDVEVDLDFVYSRVKGFEVECLGALTIETNANNAAGGQTINVPAGGWVWMSGSVEANPFTVDVTKVFLTNATAVANPVKIRVLYDSTP